MELQWIQKENELAQEKAEVRKMAALFNQVMKKFIGSAHSSCLFLVKVFRHCERLWLILRLPGIR